MTSTRRAIRSSSTGRGRLSPTWTAGTSYTCSGSDAVNGRPVSSITSRARTSRRPLLGRMARAAAGSRSASRLCSAAGPYAASSPSSRSRTAGSVPGKSSRSSAART